MIYSASNLTKVYDTRVVLDIPALEIEQGAIHALLGPNGAGKTTLLNVLAFLEPPTAGQIVFDSKTVRFTEAYLRQLRQHVVLVDQHPILFTTSVRKNIEFGLKIRKISYGQREYIIDEVLDLVGMRAFAQARAHYLSGGETQRVALARALAVSPEVFLCDEPTSSVDVENQTAILNILRQINEQKKITIIFTTHDTSQARDLAHQTIFLHQGRLGSGVQEDIRQ